ncbi:hypothetical protein DPMN_167717 [Dreissena polymorpha]|uniref:Uncharacterized protein n=1 Tax=Dreissena polymorpha TaxID=45954 RepID=A0A9D4F0D5_DREPO|nr:hypothetical protein DPMN_167717 [Dreissena polymorpha]
MLTPRIMKLHRYIDHDWQMTPIDFQVTRSKVMVTCRGESARLSSDRPHTIVPEAVKQVFLNTNMEFFIKALLRMPVAAMREGAPSLRR